MAATDLLYRIYERRLAKELAGGPVPQHIGVIVDGNRRYALERGADASEGHAAGARHIEPFLDWCLELGIPYVTLWLLSTDNLNRDDDEITRLMAIIEDTVWRMVDTDAGRRRGLKVTAVGALDVLPESTRTCLVEVERATADQKRMHVQVAVGYGGRQEITDALRSLLKDRAAHGETIDDVASSLSPDDITAHLYTTGLPDPDLIIRTSGEVRLSGFLMWQSAHSEFYFCDAYWPAFRRTDFLRALRDFQRRTRRFGR